jgi:hypothetical protein
MKYIVLKLNIIPSIQKYGRLLSRVKFITTECLLEMRANDQNSKLVEVLGREEFGKGYIPRAINIPLDQLPGLSKST